MNKKILAGLALIVAGCSSAPVTQRRVRKPSVVVKKRVIETPTIGTHLQDRWYHPRAVETKESWELYKQLYVQTERFRIAYDALQLSHALHLLDANEEMIQEYQQTSKLSSELRPHFFEAFTFVDQNTMQRIDSREALQCDNAALNSPVGVGDRLPEHMFSLYQQIQSLNSEYHFEKNKAVSYSRTSDSEQ